MYLVDFISNDKLLHTLSVRWYSQFCSVLLFVKFKLLHCLDARVIE